MSLSISIIFYILLAVIAFLYASVGHGGASGYIALMTLFNFAPAQIRSYALLLNIAVSIIAFYHYHRSEKIQWRIALPLLLSSIPLAFIGGGMKIDTTIYKLVLAAVLLIPIVRFVGVFPEKEKEIIEPRWYILSIVGAVIGFLSGVLGIGGGIILTPLFILFSWSSIKQAATLSALFIFLNSIAGLAANKDVPMSENFQVYIMIAIVVLMGTIGSYLGARVFKAIILKRILALVLVIAVLKLIQLL